MTLTAYQKLKSAEFLSQILEAETKNLFQLPFDHQRIHRPAERIERKSI